MLSSRHPCRLTHAFGHTLTLLALLLLVQAFPLAGQENPLDGLDAYVTRVMRDWQAPGIAVAIVKDDEVIFAKGFGVKEIGNTDPVTERSLFAVASTTKAFTTAALGMLVDEGKLSWDDPVTKHLPWFQLSDPYASREMTVRDLLSHRGGLPRGDRLWYGSPYDREEVVRRVRKLEPAWSFRSRYGYQNVMFVTAGEVVEEVSGMSWDRFLDERIFTPLGMSATTTTTRGIESTPDHATPHIWHAGEIKPIPWRDFDNVGGAGAVNSSAWEMAQWVRLQLGEGEYDGRRLLSEEVIREMHAPQTVVRIGAETEEMYPETHFMAYGLGWRLQDYRGKKIVRHGGALDGMRTHVGLIPEEELGVVVITNFTASSVPQAIMYHIFDAFLGPRDKDWSAVMLAASRRSQARADSTRRAEEAERVTDTRPSLPLEGYVGTYEDGLYGSVLVRVEGERLVVEVGPQFVGELSHWHYDTFRSTWRDWTLGRAWVTFQLGRDGNAESMTVSGFGEFRKTESAGVGV